MTFINPINSKTQDPMQIPQDWAGYTTTQKQTYLQALDGFNTTNHDPRT